MSEKICIGFSLGDHVQTLLENVRREYPDAHIAMLIPKNHTFPEHEAVEADEVIYSLLSTRDILHPIPMLKFVLQLRKRRFDLAVLQFESIKGRLIATFIKPKRAHAWLNSGEKVPMSTYLPVMMYQFFRARLRGYTVVVKAWTHAHLIPVRPTVKVPPRDQ